VAAAIIAGPQNKAATAGQSVQLSCKTVRGTCENVTWARNDENGIPVILRMAGKMMQVQTDNLFVVILWAPSLLQLIIFPCLFVVLNTQICLNLYLIKFNHFADTCMER